MVTGEGDDHSPLQKSPFNDRSSDAALDASPVVCAAGNPLWRTRETMCFIAQETCSLFNGRNEAYSPGLCAVWHTGHERGAETR